MTTYSSTFKIRQSHRTKRGSPSGRLASFESARDVTCFSASTIDRPLCHARAYVTMGRIYRTAVVAPAFHWAGPVPDSRSGCPAVSCHVFRVSFESTCHVFAIACLFFSFSCSASSPRMSRNRVNSQQHSSDGRAREMISVLASSGY